MYVKKYIYIYHHHSNPFFLHKYKKRPQKPPSFTHITIFLKFRHVSHVFQGDGELPPFFCLQLSIGRGGKGQRGVTLPTTHGPLPIELLTCRFMFAPQLFIILILERAKDWRGSNVRQERWRTG